MHICTRRGLSACSPARRQTSNHTIPSKSLRHPAPAIYHLLRLLAGGCPSSNYPLSPSSFCTTQPPKVQQQLVQALLTTCRESPQALAAVVPNLRLGAVALMKALRNSAPAAGEWGLAPPEIPELALPLVLQGTLTVAQVG